jgi:hypothetical protein
MTFFIGSGIGLGVAAGAIVRHEPVAGVGLLLAAFFMLMTGFSKEGKK